MTGSAAPEGIVPAQNLDAEEHVLGAILLAGADGLDAGRAVVDAVRATGLEAVDFYRPSHGCLYVAALALAERGEATDAVSVAAELEARGQLASLAEGGPEAGKVRVHELARIVPAASNAPTYARLVRASARTRTLHRALGPIVEAAQNGGVDPTEALAAITEARAAIEAADAPAARSRFLTGGAFILDAAETVRAVWGNGAAALWAEGESLMLVGPEGVSKSTVAERLALARAGIGPTSVLGLPVEPSDRRVLYLALDRPRQIARSFRRMVSEADREALDERVVIHSGALVLDLLGTPRKPGNALALAELAVSHGAGTVIIDSLKDLGVSLVTDEGGTAVNLARQHALSAGVEVLEVHHQRKAQADNKAPKTLADVYGSRLLTAGAGSVICLWGEAGDVLVELRHLKQPGDELGPWTIAVDHATGAVAVHDATDVGAVLAQNPQGVTAAETAAAIFATTSPTRAQVEKARRRLERKVGEGDARRIDPLTPGDPVRWAERVGPEARA